MIPLISERVPFGGEHSGPVNAPVYPVLSDIRLNDAKTFGGGPPFADFARLRATSPVAWISEDGEDYAGFWAVTRYHDVMRVNGDAQTFSSQRGGILAAYGRPGERHEMLHRASLDAMITMDDPWHMPLRREHMPFFTPRYIDQLKVRVRAEVSRLLDEMATRGECDLVEALSSQLPLFTLCEILGVPEPDRPKFLRWMHFLEIAGSFAAERAAGKAIEPTVELMTFIQDFNNAVEEMFAYGREMLHKRRLDPQPDLMSAIARAQIDGTLLSDEYLDGSWLLIVFAGNDTTRNTISGSVKLVSEAPDQRAKLLANPGLIPGAVNEFIRMVSPVIYMRRTATRDVEVGGQRIAEGEKVVMYYGSANRDEAVFLDPDRLDVQRPNADKSLAFGYGPHVCIGKRVATMQLEAVWEQLLARVPDIAYAGEGIDVAPNNFVYAIRKLPVTFTPERRAA